MSPSPHEHRNFRARDMGAQTPSGMPVHKYAPYQPIGLEDRTWPSRQLTRAPLWGSVDLRDGNQALLEPMDVNRKRIMFDLLVSIGFKEIEVGYPASSQDDYDFVRHLIETDSIPDDVVIQVLCSMRTDAIDRSVDAVRGAPRAVLQYINPTSVAQRRVVFRASREETVALALEGTRHAVRLQENLRETELFLSYVPESWSQTEPEFGVEICNAVLEYCAPRTDRTLRIALPATVECFPPHELADRIEYTCRNLAYRDRTILTLHPHNDRGSAVAASELAILAGVDRVEGCLFGNGERTGNVCLPTLAMNLFSQGIDPMLDLRDLDGIRSVVEECNQLPVSARHPWVGEFVYTSFAGTHQDAIAKGLKAREEAGDPDAVWDVPYLAVDPRDIGRSYQALIRINTQSGKGGIAHLLLTTQGLPLPRPLQIDFAHVMQKFCERRGGEVGADELWALFAERYVAPGTEPGEGTAGTPEISAADWTAGDWKNSVGRAFTAQEIPGVVQSVTVERLKGRPGYAAFCEAALNGRPLWGVGIHAEETEAVRRAALATARRARDEERSAPYATRAAAAKEPAA
ncbi:2-isopropylmalate synthase [Saccharothrix tamanrassetensis]|uniref:2-isopropylmalate synthase n=1 Tax=Saccharothrix tamanrassetensis TaxID=1051531 RepID=A0A841CDE3_9PSEU|nr:2-isopropylmalate synthase [Saccharothrix tamanrassetensis]MBB5954187.1 2-isopropylmalate synthase [Saccharothrix tamanrassetensis]